MSKHAIAILESEQIRTTGADLKDLGQQALAELDAIRQMETGAALRALRFGLVMYRVKATVKHGQFQPWQKKTFGGTAERQCQYYMKLAAAFVERAKLDVQGVLALPAANGELLPAKQSGAARSALEAAIEYIDGRSLNECLADEGIKAKKKPVKRGGGGTGDDTTEETTEAEREVTVQDRFNDIDDLLRRARKAVADKAVWMSFSKKQHADLKAAADQTAEVVTDLFVKTHGRNAK